MDFYKELEEAVSATDRVLETIDYALKELGKAKNWGIFDIFKGGMISSYVKHDKMENAEIAVKNLREEFLILEKELGDVGMDLENYEIPSTSSKFLDIFVDNIFSDLKNQSRIKENIRILENLREEILIIQKDLKIRMEKYE